MEPKCFCGAKAVEMLELNPGLNAPLCETHGTRWIKSVYRRAAIRFRHETGGQQISAHAFEEWVKSEQSSLPVDDVIAG